LYGIFVDSMLDSPLDDLPRGVIAMTQDSGKPQQSVLQALVLMSAAAASVHARRGHGEACALCGKPITTAQTGYQLRFRANTTPRTVHVGCFFSSRAVIDD